MLEHALHCVSVTNQLLLDKQRLVGHVFNSIERSLWTLSPEEDKQCGSFLSHFHSSDGVRGAYSIV